MKDYNKYMREYKRRRRATLKAEKFEADDYFLTMSCISLEEAEKIGRGACNGWAVCSALGMWYGDDIGGIFDRVLTKLDSRSNVFVENLKIWGRFIVAECVRRGYKAATSTSKKHTYRLIVDASGAWISIQINMSGTTIYVKDFTGIIKTSLSDACLVYLERDLSENLQDIAEAMQQIYVKFNDLIYEISGASIKASTIAGYAKKIYLYLLGSNDMTWGRMRYSQMYPELPKVIMDEIRESKVYRSGLNYMPEHSKKYTGAVVAYDRRSFYPFIYSSFKLPFGKVFERDYLDVLIAQESMSNFDDDFYVVYDVEELSASLMPGGVPCIQIINSSTETEYLKDINFMGDCKFMLDTYDLKALYENYDVNIFSVKKCYVWHRKYDNGLTMFANKLFAIKENHKGDAIGVVAKFLINSIIGQFGARAYRTETTIEDNRYVRSEAIYKGETGYLPVAMCVNSIGRYLLSRDIRAAKDKYLYGDSDSVLTSEPIELLENKLGRAMGDYDVNYYVKSKFLLKKCYGLQRMNGNWRWVVSGASPDMLKQLERDTDFYAGKMITGGVIPVMFDDMTLAFKSRDFTIAKQSMIF